MAGLGLKVDLQRLFEADEQVAALCILDGASLIAFLEHVGVVEGCPDSNAALAAFVRGDSRFKNMPCWENSIWLPFDFEPAGTLDDDPTLFVGSGDVSLDGVDIRPRTEGLANLTGS